MSTFIPDEIKELNILCRAGRLYEVEAWIREGKPVLWPQRPSKSPLWVSINTGFHSLVELFLKSGVRPERAHLQHAMFTRQTDMVELLVKYGADVHWVSFEDVFRTGDRQLMDLFIQKGADPIAGAPLAMALKTVIRPLLGFYRSYRDQYPDLQLQIDMALRYACEEGKLGAVCKLLWAGANPRASVPSVDAPGDEDWNHSPLEMAVWRGHVPIVDKIGIDPTRDDLNLLLDRAAFAKSPDLIRRLVEAGANPSGVGEHQPLRNLFCVLGWDLKAYYASDRDGSQALECIKLMIELGTKIEPRDRHDFSVFRQPLYSLEPGQFFDLIGQMQKHHACCAEVFRKLLKSPTLKTRLRGHQDRLMEVLSFLKRRPLKTVDAKASDVRL